MQTVVNSFIIEQFPRLSASFKSVNIAQRIIKMSIKLPSFRLRVSNCMLIDPSKSIFCKRRWQVFWNNVLASWLCSDQAFGPHDFSDPDRRFSIFGDQIRTGDPIKMILVGKICTDLVRWSSGPLTFRYRTGTRTSPLH